MSFSIIIPVRKNESCLAKQLDSIFQSLKGDEIILLDTNISENYWEIWINYFDKHRVDRGVKKQPYSVFSLQKFVSKDGINIL